MTGNHAGIEDSMNIKPEDVIAYVRHLIDQGETNLQLIDQILAKPWKWADEINQWLETQPVDIRAGHLRRHGVLQLQWPKDDAEEADWLLDSLKGNAKQYRFVVEGTEDYAAKRFWDPVFGKPEGLRGITIVKV